MILHAANALNGESERFAMVQARVTAAQAHDTAVRSFREGRLDDPSAAQPLPDTGDGGHT